NSGLSAELANYANRFFVLNNLQNVFECYRLKVQTIAGIEVGRNGFGVIVDDDGPITHLLERPHAVNTRVIKLNSLSNSNGARPEDKDSGLHANFILPFITKPCV